MKAVVVDASALTEYLLRTACASFIENELANVEVDLHIPALCDVEVASVLRRAIIEGRLSPERATEALRDLCDLPLTRHGHQLLLERILQLHHNFSAYDATYVALAERMKAELLTADRGLARAVRNLGGLTVLTAGSG